MAERQISKRSRALFLLWRLLRWAMGGGLALVGLSGSIYALLGGSFWPTEPRFSPGPPSLGSSFDVPFTVTNDSKFFRVYHLNISCALLKLTLEGPSNIPVTIQRSLINHATNQVLWTSDSRPYKCGFRGLISIIGQDVADLKVKYAYISFISEYDSPWTGERTKSMSGPFTLVTSTSPMYWTAGLPLR
jgi:hypothetical protein